MTTSLAVPERGTLSIAEQAVQRLAAHAVAELDDVGGSAGRFLGVSLAAEDLDRSAKVTAHVTGGEVRLDVRLSITYPASVTRTTERAREHLENRVEELTGLVVTRVDITVTALHTTAARRGRVE
ncbi:Asp23/Gls24 family envelope stress response protein [Amycolatopsis sp. lyj-23]|uniref:Asp23/Gls24 family envelope stress response protein n=1 Tax=Amycolatopsis sp. lyj-23 TaxID=2789283 RepID=UPI0039782051